jgi:hypothetical protein
VALTIPKEHHSALAKLKDLPATVFDALIAGLSKESIEPDPAKVSTHLKGTIDGISEEDLNDVIETIFALYRVRAFVDVGHAKFVNDLMTALRDTGDPALRLDKEQARDFHDRLATTLEIQTLNTVAKGITLQRDGERLYCEAKILSDMRPVFGEDVTAGPVGFVVKHDLKIVYHERRAHREFYVVLDDMDLGRLQEVVERAVAKAALLREFLTKANLPDLGA